MKRQSNRATKANAARHGGSVRIIAGQWRGRKLPVPDVPGLRPTSDRSRETLFNWLQPWLPGARCLDLFAGSGALGFEAASRGAASVVMVEQSAQAVACLQRSRELLAAEQVSIEQGHALRWLDGLASPSPANPSPASHAMASSSLANPTVSSAAFDIVFVDPPFDSSLAVQALNALQQNACIAEGGFVYAESPARFPELVMIAPFAEWRSKQVGESRLQLFRHQS